MLKMLRCIVQEVNAAHDFKEALKIMVSRVREAVETQSCTVFLVEQDTNNYVLMATSGLNPDIVGKVRVEQNQGLVGLVGEREEPINLEDAPSHPNFLFHPDVGEEQFKAFLGVPIIHHRKLFGVLVVQQEESRRFDESEESFLVTMSAQLAAIIAHAQATGNISALFASNKRDKKKEGVFLEGVASSLGVGIGQAVVVYPPADLEAVPDRKVENIEEEIEQFNAALTEAREEVKVLGERLSKNLPEEEQQLFEVFARILGASGIGDEVCTEIRAGNWAQGALRKIIKKHVRQFEAMDDPYLRERATDIRDLGLRVLAKLQEDQHIIAEYPEQTILIGDEVTAAALAEVPEGQLAGVVSSKGSSSSHVAILARALGVPTVMGVSGLALCDCTYENETLIVDGYYGQVYIKPSEELLREFEVLAEEERELDTNLQELLDLPAITPDGHNVSLFVNTGLAADAGMSLTVGAQGVGLFRTEVPFMIRDHFPAEEEQRIIYKQLLNAFSPRPVIMRTLDVGGDKPLPYFPVVEDNPFLGWRGIRLTLDHPDVFLVQVRAMLKASQGFDNLRIMLPMITSVHEFDEAANLIDQAYKEVCEEGFEISKPPVGVMIEIPSAVYQAKSLAKRADFLSVGSNDLTQYILAVDRNNPRVANLYDWLHPAVIAALSHVVEATHAEGKQVSICGEMASDPAAVIILIALGFDAMSMSSVSLPRIKWVIRNITMEHATQLLAEVQAMEEPRIIRYHLEQVLDQAGLGGLIRAGK